MEAFADTLPMLCMGFMRNIVLKGKNNLCYNCMKNVLAILQRKVASFMILIGTAEDDGAVETRMHLNTRFRTEDQLT